MIRHVDSGSYHTSHYAMRILEQKGSYKNMSGLRTMGIDVMAVLRA